MRLLPGPHLPPLAAARLNDSQNLSNALTRQALQNASLQVNPIMCQNSVPPSPLWNQKTQKVLNVSLMIDSLGNVARGFLPHVCEKHVYRFDHKVIRDQRGLETVIYAKWTFFNDLDVKLKIRWYEDMDAEINHTNLRKSLEPMCEDYEAWMATAIMACEAGEDIWERPKPSAVQRAYSQFAASINQQASQQASQLNSLATQQSSISQGLLGGGYGSGLLGGLGTRG